MFALTLRAKLWLLEQKWSYAGGFTAAKESARRRALAAWLRDSLLALGARTPPCTAAQYGLLLGHEAQRVRHAL